MAYSKTDICNFALNHLGEEAVRNADDEYNKRARVSSRFYNICRDWLLSKHDWSFARKIADLQEVLSHDLDLEPGWYAFQLPNDCRTPRDILPLGSRDPWAMAGKVLIAKKSSVTLIYTAQEITTAMYTDTFVDLLALRMAVKMAPVMTQDKTLTQTLAQQFEIEQADAWESDSNIGNSYRDYDDDPENDTFVNTNIAASYIQPGDPAQ